MISSGLHHGEPLTSSPEGCLPRVLGACRSACGGWQTSLGRPERLRKAPRLPACGPQLVARSLASGLRNGQTALLPCKSRNDPEIWSKQVIVACQRHPLKQTSRSRSVSNASPQAVWAWRHVSVAHCCLFSKEPTFAAGIAHELERLGPRGPLASGDPVEAQAFIELQPNVI